MTARSRITAALVLVAVYAASEQVAWWAALLLSGYAGAWLALLNADES